ncbi:membrane protein [Pseudomonas aeruginosa]|nr:membrane protein [Pseudomonas aeruginosa]
MLKKSFNSLLATWLAGLLVMLPLVLTVALLAWVVSLLNRFVGPSSLIGRGFAAIGQPLAGDSPLAYLLGTALLLVAIYLLGLGVQLGLKRPLANLFDLTLRRTPLIGNLYNLADRFVGLLDKKQDADIAAMSPVWCFFGGDGAAVLALMPNPEAVELDGRAHYAILVPTAPIPVGGGLLYVPVEWVKPAQIGMDTFTSIYVSMASPHRRRWPPPRCWRSRAGSSRRRLHRRSCVLGNGARTDLQALLQVRVRQEFSSKADSFVPTRQRTAAMRQDAANPAPEARSLLGSG